MVSPMGQMVSVIEKPSSIPGVVRFESNRTLTGQGHERFASADDAVGVRPSAELARRLFATGQVEGVHVYSNIITVNLRKGFGSDGLYDIVRELYQYWKPGMEPTVFIEEAPADSGGAADGASVAPAGGVGDSEYTRRVPPILVERSRAALAKWRASH
ncbi:MAG: hypothetical protein RLZZ623_3334 [Actinomycetota bacterium]|jgi:hypothetical protein